MCEAESSGTDIVLAEMLFSSADVFILCSLHWVYYLPPVFLFEYRLPLPLRLGYWLYCNFGGSGDDLHRSE